jgi:hypothetical protein
VGVPLAHFFFLCRLVLRAVRVRLQRDDYSKQYEHWKATQRSRIFTSIGKSGRDQLDTHAAELKRGRDVNDKLLTSIIETLAQYPETPTTVVDLGPAIEEARRYTLEAQRWMEQVRPLLPADAEGERSRGGDGDGDVEMTGDAPAETEPPALKKRRLSLTDIESATPQAAPYLARLKALEDRANEIEANPEPRLVLDLNELVERAFRTRSSLEAGEVCVEQLAMAGAVLTPEQAERRHRQMDERMQQVAKDRQTLSAKIDASATELVAWRKRCTQLEARDAEVSFVLRDLLSLLIGLQRSARFETLEKVVQSSSKELAELASKFRKLHARKKPPPPDPPVSAQFVEKVYQAVRLRVGDDIAALGKSMREATKKHVDACDERLFAAVLSRLQPTIKVTEALYRYAERDTEKM